MKSVRFTFLFLFVAGLNSFGFGSVPPPITGSSTPSCWPPPCIPVDNGVIFLVVAGALYGAKKIYDTRKKSLTHS